MFIIYIPLPLYFFDIFLFQVTTPTNKETPAIDIEEIPVDATIPAGVEECDVSLSEEPADETSPAPRCKKSDHKRKLGERTSLTEAEIAAKKHDNRDTEDIIIPPPPPSTAPIPEPMECVEDQVYERPRERRVKEEERTVAKDAERTPKVRRRQKNSGELIVSKSASDQPESKQDSIKKSTFTPKIVRRKKSPQAEDSSKPIEPFERPEPQPSPRPPRENTPPIQHEPPQAKIKIDSEILPPPLPEKKRKSIGKEKSPQKPQEELQPLPDSSVIIVAADSKNSAIENAANICNEPLVNKNEMESEIKRTTNCDLESNLLNETLPVMSDKESPEKNHCEKVSDVIIPSNVINAPVPPKSKELRTEISETEESVSGKSRNVTDPEQKESILAGVTKPGNLPDTLSSLPNQSQQIQCQESLGLNHAKEEEKGKVDNTKIERLVKPHPTMQLEPEDDFKSQQPPWVNQDKGRLDKGTVCSKKVQDLENSVCSPNLDRIEKAEKVFETNSLPKVEEQSSTPKLKRSTEDRQSLKQSETNRPIVNKENNILSPKLKRNEVDLCSPNVQRPEEATAAASPKIARPDSEAMKPSINNLPKLVVKNISVEEQESYEKPSSPSINNLPKLKQVPTTDYGPEKEKSSPPLVVPFPGKQNDPLLSVSLSKQESPKSLINNIPKPFKPEAEVNSEAFNGQSPTQSVNDNVTKKSSISPETAKPLSSPVKSDSVGSCISLSSDDEGKSEIKTPTILPKPNGPNMNYSTLSPSNSGSNIEAITKKGPDKRDSKVIKAAAYWNNYIGEVKSKSKPPSNPKMMEKPKKITSAGIGERGLKELTSAFEHGKPIQTEDKFTLLRRNSKKMNVESCNPGLRVNDAKSVFEKKFQQTEQTPRLGRRASSTLEKPKVNQSKDNIASDFENKAESQESLPQKDIPTIEVHIKSNSKSKSKSPLPQSDIRKDEIPGLHLKPSSALNSVSADKESLVRQNAESDDKSKPSTSQASKVTPEIDKSLKSDNLTQQLPKPPTSPKPKVRKEDLKVKENIIVKSKDSKANQASPSVEPQPLVAPLITEEKPISEKAKIIQLKENTSIPIKSKQEPVQKTKPVEPAEQEPIKTSKEGDVTKIVFNKKSNVDSIKPTNGLEHSENIKITKESEVPKMLVKTIKIKSPEPEKVEAIKSPNLSEIRGSLKKVPPGLVIRRKSSPENEDSKLMQKLNPDEKSEVHIPLSPEPAMDLPNKNVSEKNAKTPFTLPSAEPGKIQPPSKERIIPITLVNENQAPKPYKNEFEEPKPTIQNVDQAPRNEHHIPILVERKTMSSRTDIPDEDAERLDNFNASNISRRRWGSRKKRMSSAFSDSSMSDDEALLSPLSGLQKYTSYGKHGLGEQPLFRLKKTRPPFSADKTESFSSGEDDFDDDDGFQEMTAENLFSTLLSRVKSLTRRIHDEHDDPATWNRGRHGPPKLNPGGTHARLERTAQRNSFKRPGDYSRQTSGYEEQRSYNESPSHKSFNSSYVPTKIYNRSNSNNEAESRYSTGSQYSTGSNKRYDESDTASDFSSSVSVTSSQRLRPGYLPPPANHNTGNASNINPLSANSNDLDAQYFAQNLTTKANDNYERNIPINIQKSFNSDSPGHSKPGTPLPTPGVYMKHMKPYSTNSTDVNDRLEASDQSGDTADRQRRVSRFLRPDFYDIPKEDSIYAKMKELEDEDKKKPRFLRVVHSRGRDSNSGRSTPLDSSYSEDRTRMDTKTPVFDYGESPTPSSEGQFLNRALSLKRQNSLKEPSSQLSVLNHVVTDTPYNPQPSFQPTCLVHDPETAQKSRRPIHPYVGAKSDGQLLNKHAHVTLNVIAAAERKKRQSFFHQEEKDDAENVIP